MLGMITAEQEYITVEEYIEGEFDKYINTDEEMHA